MRCSALCRSWPSACSRERHADRALRPVGTRVVRLDDQGARSVATLERVGESVIDSRVDVEVRETARRELALDCRDERPDQASPAVTRIDKDVEETRPSARPARPRDGEAEQRLAIPERSDHGVRIRHLTAHLARRERARTPLGTFQLEHPSADPPPGRLPRSEQLDGWRHRLSRDGDDALIAREIADHARCAP